MNEPIRKISRLVYTMLLFLALSACTKDEPENMLVRTGNWSGTDIAFYVGGSPLNIGDLEFFYSGHAVGNICSFDYESAASFADVANIDGNVFLAEISTFSISGTFINDTTAEIVIDWTGTDTNCDATYSGQMTYEAFHQKTE